MYRYSYHIRMKKRRKECFRRDLKKIKAEKICDSNPPGSLSDKHKKIRNAHPLSSRFFTELRPFQPVVQVLGPIEHPKRIMSLRISCCDLNVVFDRIGFRLKFADRVKADGLDKPGRFPKLRILDYRILYETNQQTRNVTKFIVISEYHIMEENIPRNISAKPFNGRYIPFFEKLKKLVNLHIHNQQTSAEKQWKSTIGVIQKIGKLEWRTSKNKLILIRDIEFVTKHDDGSIFIRMYGENAVNFKADEGEVMEITGEKVHFEMTHDYADVISYLMMKKGSKYFLNPHGTETVFIVKVYHLGWSGKFEMDVGYKPFN